MIQHGAFAFRFDIWNAPCRFVKADQLARWKVHKQEHHILLKYKPYTPLNVENRIVKRSDNAWIPPAAGMTFLTLGANLGSNSNRQASLRLCQRPLSF